MRILRRTTSSPEESLGSNLHRAAVVLSSLRARSRVFDFAEIIPHTKKLWRAVRAADVIGPVDKEERIISKNGESMMGNGRDDMSIMTLKMNNRLLN